MQTSVAPRRIVNDKGALVGASIRAPCGLSFYADTPDEEITLEDVEVYSFNRLKGM